MHPQKEGEVIALCVTIGVLIGAFITWLFNLSGGVVLFVFAVSIYIVLYFFKLI